MAAGSITRRSKWLQTALALASSCVLLLLLIPLFPGSIYDAQQAIAGVNDWISESFEPGPATKNAERIAELEEGRKRIRDNPSDVEAHMWLGRRVSMSPEGLAEFTEAVKLDPMNAEAHAYRAEEFRNLDDSKSAIKELRLAVALDKGDHWDWRLELQGEIEKLKEEEQIRQVNIPALRVCIQTMFHL